MNWLSALILLVGVAHAVSECFSKDVALNSTTTTTSDASKDQLDLSAVTSFGVDLFQNLVVPENSTSNLCFSPFNIWTALALTYLGSEGNTRKELGAALRVSEKPALYSLLRRAERLRGTVQKNGTNTFNFVNRIYVDTTLPLTQCIKDSFTTELRSVSFKDAEKTAADINKHVANVTKGNIRELLTSKDIADASMALVSAVFFKGVWKFQFRPSLTSERDFFTPSSQNATPVAMMSLTGRFKHGVSSQLGASILELPYAADNISMFLLLPNTDKPLGERFTHLVKNLNKDSLLAAISPTNLKAKEVDILLPKFKFELKLGEELKTALQKAGIADLFDERKANLTGFSQQAALHVTSAIHRATVEVNEEGTVASAGTGLTFSVKLSNAGSSLTEFYCEHPFVFLIWDHETKASLFSGTVVDPSKL